MKRFTKLFMAAIVAVMATQGAQKKDHISP